MTATLDKATNADPAELAKFSALAHRWWDTTGEFKPLHAINPLRLDWIDQAATLQDKKVLDIGCGGGILADSMARRGANVLGIDLATKALKVAQLHAIEAQTPNIDYREISAMSGRPVGSLGPTRERIIRKMRATQPMASLLAAS